MCIIEYYRLGELCTQNMQTLLLGSPMFKLHKSVALRVNHDSITISLSLKKWQASATMRLNHTSAYSYRLKIPMQSQVFLRKTNYKGLVKKKMVHYKVLAVKGAPSLGTGLWKKKTLETLLDLQMPQISSKILSTFLKNQRKIRRDLLHKR